MQITKTETVEVCDLCRRDPNAKPLPGPVLRFERFILCEDCMHLLRRFYDFMRAQEPRVAPKSGKRAPSTTKAGA